MGEREGRRRSLPGPQGQPLRIGVAKMRRSGALPSSSEMALFELMVDSKHEQFRAISRMVK